MNRNNNSNLATPISIVIAGFMVASAIYLSNTGAGLGLQQGSSDTTRTANNNPNIAAPSDNQGDSAGQDAEVEAGQNESGTYTVSVDDDPVLGDPNAPVTLIEFGDYRCPFCTRFWENTLPTLKEDYVDTGKVKLVYRDLSIHPPQSDIASEASHCAADQNMFWDYHDTLFTKFQEGETFTKDVLKNYAGEVGLNQSQFDQCLDSGKYEEEHKQDGQDARAASATGTPTVFIGKSTESGELEASKIVGAQPTATFTAEIDKLLEE